MHSTRFVVLSLLLALACGCKPERWEGVPDSRARGSENPHHETVCIADGKVYQCVRDGSRMLCVQPTVAVLCTGSVNVETVFPGQHP
jgi:hypothetical protein